VLADRHRRQRERLDGPAHAVVEPGDRAAKRLIEREHDVAQRAVCLEALDSCIGRDRLVATGRRQLASRPALVGAEPHPRSVTQHLHPRRGTLPRFRSRERIRP